VKRAARHANERSKPSDRDRRPASPQHGVVVSGLLATQQAAGNQATAHLASAGGRVQRDPTAAAEAHQIDERSAPPGARERFQEGWKAFREGDHRRALRIFLESFAEVPTAGMQYNIARCHEELGDPARAIQSYRLYLELDPEASDAATVEERIARLMGEVSANEAGPLQGEDLETGRGVYLEADAAYQSGDYARAYGLFAELYAVAPSPALAYNLGQAADRWGQPERAIRHFRLYLEEEPGASDADDVRSRIERLQPQAEVRQRERSDWLAVREQQDPTAPRAPRDIMEASQRRRRRQAADLYDRGAYDEAYRLFAELFAETRDVRLIYDLAACQLRLRNYRRALRLALRAQSEHPEPSTEAMLRVLQQELGSSEDLSGAAGLMAEAGRAYNTGDYDRAIEIFGQLYTQTRMPDMVYNLARTYEAAGNREAAARFFQRYLDLAPEAEDVDAVRERIARFRGSD
jgi:tetratricopeptide (TPR) repeat protein